MRLIGKAGYDFVFIDTQHTSFNWETLADFCDMARASGVIPILRPYDKTPALAQRMLDIGAMGLLYPDVDTGAEAQALLRGAKYSPEGTRGMTGRGQAVTDYTQSGKLSSGDVRRFVNDNVLFSIQIENAEAVENIDEILSGGGIDVVEVGRGDLSTSYGHPSETRHPKVLAALDKIIESCARHGAAAGAGCYSLEDSEDMVARGMRWLTYATDRQILQTGYNDGFKLLSSLVDTHGKKAGQ
jgi:4-hydroxy-2-oxoheptanedioate aldolase